jgi:hypothetical protein
MSEPDLMCRHGRLGPCSECMVEMMAEIARLHGANTRLAARAEECETAREELVRLSNEGRALLWDIRHNVTPCITNRRSFEAALERATRALGASTPEAPGVTLHEAVKAMPSGVFVAPANRRVTGGQSPQALMEAAVLKSTMRAPAPEAKGACECKEYWSAPSDHGGELEVDAQSCPVHGPDAPKEEGR